MTPAINIRYFFITDQVEKGNVAIQYCPAGQMIGDFFTKPFAREEILSFFVI
jgi:hypothetical protein